MTGLGQAQSHSSPPEASRLGTLYLIPVPLWAPGERSQIPLQTLAVACRLRYFLVEDLKVARRILKDWGHPEPLARLALHSLKVRNQTLAWDKLMEPLLLGEDLGLLSDAGCPAVADPGAEAVAWAHRHGCEVRPLVGPSAPLLALMASGLNGQSFAFHGYLTLEPQARSTTLAHLERRSRQQQETQILIETPYRNRALLDFLCSELPPTTRLCVAQDLTGPGQWVRTASVAQWRHGPLPESWLERAPAVFLFMS